MSQFDISYNLCIVIKGQALVDFIAKFTYAETTEITRTTMIVKAVEKVEMAKNEGSPVETS